MIEKSDVDACVRSIVELCAIPSPSGFTQQIVRDLTKRLSTLGFNPVESRKKSVLCGLGGEGSPLVLAAHVDTLGAMVRSIKDNGRLRYTRIGGYPEIYTVTETCLVHTRGGATFSGTIQPVSPAVHVNKKLREFKSEEEYVEVVLDLPVSNKAEVAGFGIAPGDFISFDPRSTVTDTGYIKSRHLDDKASAGILLSLASLVAEGRMRLNRKVYILFTTYEEVGHGGSSGVPTDAEEMISVDMGAVGDDLGATEHHVSICAKDSGGPYDYEVVSRLIDAANAVAAAYAVDVYPFYGSDVEATLRAGYDLAHGLIGPGVSASHGYERTHVDGIRHTLALLARYVAVSDV